MKITPKSIKAMAYERRVKEYNNSNCYIAPKTNCSITPKSIKAAAYKRRVQEHNKKILKQIEEGKKDDKRTV